MFNKKIDINKINEKYCALIEDLDFMMNFGACDRLLLYPKQEIENALLTQAIYYKETCDQKKLNITTLCYTYLSLFIPYEKYNIVKICYGLQGFEELIKQSKEIKEKFIQIQEEILVDMRKRTEKLIELTAIFKPGITDLVAERKKALEDFRGKVYNLQNES